MADLRVADRVEAAFTAEPGEVLAVIGPNGAGKSSLLHAVAGLVDVDGSARLGDADLLTLPVRERRVGLVFQGQLLFPHLSALDNVAFGLRARGEPRAAAEAVARDWLERFGIAELAARKPRELSGGQAQRVAIARALATEPDVLLLDEPFTGLDVSVQMALRIELGRHLRDFPGIALLVTHDAIDALTLADRVLVLDDGQVVQVGRPADVAAEPRTSHVARLVGLNLVADGDELMAFTPDAVVVSLHEPEGSTRLRWHGPIATLAPHGDAVRLLVHASPDLLADLTPAAATELELAPGREVWLSAKATAVSRYAARR
ncbi:sulfate/molybdate ABC transporter ATP-binding protein [Nocardioides pinisoli]|uniref:ATP-binding cassette domain-containing protein n=1 Tax=Nocardioides pinisoli TaxID=2950279 RepID=A0ABT1KYN0_9ACTN|nr:ATP-binding cassette domain-containing protein [Nocardioides pinisoli]MCP3422868.1 ATP-binding cassette domain-containing protein [Nocardioides pinisoli]